MKYAEIDATPNQHAITGLQVELVGDAVLVRADGLIEALILVAASKVERLSPAVLVEV